MKKIDSTFGKVINIIENSRDNALRKVNEELIRMYWSVGVILCTSKDDEVVEYSMSRTMSQLLVSKYSMELPDKSLLRKKLREFSQLLEMESDK